MTSVDRPHNGQGDEPAWVEPFYRWAKTDKSPGSYSAAFAAGWVAAGRAGAGEQQREQVARWLRERDIRREGLAGRAGRPWSQSADADELLALLGGPQPDGEAGRG